MNLSPVQTKYKSLLQSQQVQLQNEITKLKDAYKTFIPEEVSNYRFKSIIGETHLSSLFRDKDELIVIHNMGKSCNYCTLWADGFNGYYQQLKTRVEFVLVSNDSPEDQYTFATSRNWKFPVYSARDTSFTKDMGFSDEKDNSYLPGISIFKKEISGKISRTNAVDLGEGDLFCSLWYLLDLLPNSSEHWSPKSEVIKIPNAGVLDIDGFNIAEVYVENLSESIEFYCKFLGFKVTREMTPGVLMHQQNAELTVYMQETNTAVAGKPNEQNRRPEVALCFNSAKGVLKCIELLKENNIKIIYQYGSVESSFAGVQFEDPSGNLIEIAGKP